MTQAHDIFAPSPVSPKSRHARSSATEAYHTDNFLKRPESMTASEHLRRRWTAQGRAASKWLLEIIEDPKASGANNLWKARSIAALSRNCCNFVTAIRIVVWL